MGPPAPKKRKNPETVLDEDTYVAALEKIIERDFFPDLPKLHDRLDWLEAVRSGDPLQIRDAQLKIIERRRGRVSQDRALVTPASSVVDPFGTPASLVAPSPAPSSVRSMRSPSQHPLSLDPLGDSDNELPVDTSMSLDAFLKRHTSEDNESFSKIIDKMNKKTREKYRYLHDAESQPEQSIAEEGDRITDGFGTSGQPESTLVNWKYTAKNLLMYDSANRGEAPLTKVEREDRVKALTKVVNTKNTRFHGKVLDSRPKEEDTVAILYTPVAGGTPASWPFAERDAERAKKRYDLEDLRKTPQLVLGDSTKDDSNKGTAGYSYVRTPSPAPGVDESPFITWGEIEGTPLRLETEDTPVGIGGGGDGPHFKIPLPPSRDVKAYNLSRDAARNLREKSRLFQKPPRTPISSRSGSASPSFSLLSAAAQKFVRNAMAKSCNSVDATLRASYRASPSPGTPKMARNAVRFDRDGSLLSKSSILGERSDSVRSPTPET